MFSGSSSSPRFPFFDSNVLGSIFLPRVGGWHLRAKPPGRALPLKSPRQPSARVCLIGLTRQNPRLGTVNTVWADLCLPQIQHLSLHPRNLRKSPYLEAGLLLV